MPTRTTRLVDLATIVGIIAGCATDDAGSLSRWPRPAACCGPIWQGLGWDVTGIASLLSVAAISAALSVWFARKELS